MFWPSVLLVALAGAAGYFGMWFPEEWENAAVLALAGVIAIVGWLVPLLRWLSRHYTITTRRIVVRSGILVRTRQEVLHSRGYSTTVRSGAGQRLFRTGDIIVRAGLDPTLVLRDVPSVDLVHDTLHDLLEQAAANKTGPAFR